MANPARASRACDGCRFRKVKCNGATPCSQCAHLALKCTTSYIPRKRTVGARGRLVEQLRQGGNAPTNTSDPPKSASPENHRHVEFVAARPPSHSGSMGSDVATSPKTPRPGKSPYSADFFISLLPAFDQIVYPVNPLVTNAEIRASIEAMNNSFEDAALVYAFGAVTVNLSQTTLEVHRSLPDLINMSLEAHRMAGIGSIRAGGLLGELPVSVKRVVTCIYLEICMMAYKLFDRSFAILREAITMIQVMQRRAKSVERFSSDPHENARWKRAYWELFIHERVLTIGAGLPSMLPPLPSGAPHGDDSIPSHIEIGFNRLISLFCILDERFLDLWASQSAELPFVAPVTREWIEGKQAELDHDEAETAASQSKMTLDGQEPLNELQLADLFVTRLWMRTMVWQIALSCGHLRSDPVDQGHEGLSLHFPAHRLSSQLRSLVTRLESVASLGAHGSGILEKLFEITSTVADVLALPTVQGKSQDEDQSRMDDLMFLVQFFLGFERVNAQQKAYIQEKVESLQDRYRHVDFGL